MGLRNRYGWYIITGIILATIICCTLPSDDPEPTPPPTWDYTLTSTPADGASIFDQTPAITWSIDATAVAYEFRIASSEAGLEAATVVSSGTASYSWTAAAIGFETDMYWQIRVDEGSGFSSWSPAQQFLVTKSIPISLVSPIGGTTTATVAPAFDWNDVSGATKYNMTVYLQSDHSVAVSATDVEDSNFNLADYSPDLDLNPGKTYTWSVQAINDSNHQGDWSSEAIFSTP